MLLFNAHEVVLHNSDLMMEAAHSMRIYTVQQIQPLLEMQLQRAFLPQSVPAFAATEIFNALRGKYPDYTYKEAALNPTNPRNRATDWETDIINEFRNNPGKKQLIGERLTPTGKSLYSARPIQITDKKCLACHTTPDAAPETMIKRYGSANGFGWQHNEIVGAQIVSVPMSLPMHAATTTFYTFMVSLLGIFLLIFVVLNLMLNYIVVRPVCKISQVSDEISQGNLNLPEFQMTGKDEIAVLAQSFNRLRRSMEKAIKMMEDQ
jgi:protein-histidine pros-kinase